MYFTYVDSNILLKGKILVISLNEMNFIPTSIETYSKLPIVFSRRTKRSIVVLCLGN